MVIPFFFFYEAAPKTTRELLRRAENWKASLQVKASVVQGMFELERLYISTSFF